MADKASEPRELFIQMLGEMLTIERTLAGEILPQLGEEARDPELREGFEHHLEETRGHVRNVEEAFSKLGEKPQAEASRTMEGLAEQHKKVLGKVGAEELEDVVHAAAAAKTEALEVAAYTTLITMAQSMGENEVVELLEQNRQQDQETLREVQQAGEKLSGQLVAG